MCIFRSQSPQHSIPTLLSLSQLQWHHLKWWVLYCTASIHYSSQLFRYKHWLSYWLTITQCFANWMICIDDDDAYTYDNLFCASCWFSIPPSCLNQQLNNQVQGSEAIIKSLTSKLSEVEKRNKLLSGDHDALSNISLEQCDELIFTLTRSQEKLQQRKVSDEPTILTTYVLKYCTSLTSYRWVRLGIIYIYIYL